MTTESSPSYDEMLKTFKAACHEGRLKGELYVAVKDHIEKIDTVEQSHDGTTREGKISEVYKGMSFNIDHQKEIKRAIPFLTEGKGKLPAALKDFDGFYCLEHSRFFSEHYQQPIEEVRMCAIDSEWSGCWYIGEYPEMNEDGEIEDTKIHYGTLWHNGSYWHKYGIRALYEFLKNRMKSD